MVNGTTLCKAICPKYRNRLAMFGAMFQTTIQGSHIVNPRLKTPLLSWEAVEAKGRVGERTEQGKEGGLSQEGRRSCIEQ